MQQLLYARAWSRACLLVINHYHDLSGCSDRTFRARLGETLVSIPRWLAIAMERRQPAALIEALEASRAACADLNTQIYLARELQMLDEQDATALIRDSLQLLEALHELQGGTNSASPKPGLEQHRSGQNDAKATIFNDILRHGSHS